MAAPKIDYSTELTLANLDIGIILGYFFVVMFIGFAIGRKTETGEDLFLAGRSLGWKSIGFSLFASNISSSALIGLAGAAYLTGIAVSAYEWMAAAALIFTAIVVMPLYLKSKITTIPEFLELRYNRQSRLYFSAITIVLSILVDMAGGLYAGAIVLQTFFPDLVFWHITLALAIVAGLYTAIGGLKAVVYTDVIQAVILIIGCTIVTLTLFSYHDFSLSALTASVPDGHFSLVKPMDDKTLPWPGLLLGVPILGFWYWSSNQYIVQRVLGAKNLEEARAGALLGGLLKLLPLFIMVIPGAMAIGMYPDIPEPDMIFPVLVANELPVGIVGLVLAGLIAAIMSSVDSTLNSATTLIVHDFIETPERNLTEKQIGKIGRITTLILMVVAAAWAPLIQHAGNLIEYLQQAFAIMVPPVAAIFGVGYFWRKATGGAAFKTLLVGHALGIILFLIGENGVLDSPIWTIHFSINVGIMFAVSVVLLMVFSLISKEQPAANVDDFIWTKELGKPAVTKPFYRNYLVQSAALAVITLVMVIMLW